MWSKSNFWRALVAFGVPVVGLFVGGCREKGSGGRDTDTGTSCAEDAGAGGEYSLRLTLDTSYRYADEISEKLTSIGAMGLHVYGVAESNTTCNYYERLCILDVEAVRLEDPVDYHLPSGRVCVIANGEVDTWESEGDSEYNYRHSCVAVAGPTYVGDGAHVTDVSVVSCEREEIYGSSD